MYFCIPNPPTSKTRKPLKPRQVSFLNQPCIALQGEKENTEKKRSTEGNGSSRMPSSGPDRPFVCRARALRPTRARLALSAGSCSTGCRTSGWRLGQGGPLRWGRSLAGCTAGITKARLIEACAGYALVRRERASSFQQFFAIRSSEIQFMLVSDGKVMV